MKKTILRTMLCAIPAAALVACGGAEEGTVDARQSPLAAPTSTTTAQSLAIDSTGTPEDLAIANTKRYQFNGTTAAGFFTNSLTNTAVASATATKDSQATETSPATVQPPCTPQVTAPETPAPDANVVFNGQPGKDDVAGKNKCNFLDGLPLTSTTYTKTATAKASCSYVSSSTLQNSGKYKNITTTVTQTDDYTWTYTVAQGDTYPLTAFTAWDLVGETNPDGTIPVNVKALIAGESVAISKSLGTKHSFSLLDSSNVPRVTNLTVGTTAANTISLTWDATGVDQSLSYTDQLLEPTLDFGYAAVQPNFFGNATAQLSLVNGPSAKAILYGDAFWANNGNPKPLGQALAAMRVGVNKAVALNLGAGTHTLTLVATVKDNTGTVLAPVTLTQNVNIVTPGCGGN